MLSFNIRYGWDTFCRNTVILIMGAVSVISVTSLGAVSLAISLV